MKQTLAEDSTLSNSKLTPEQKRVKIAKLCGWKIGDRSAWWHDDFGDAALPPDYLNDLNAMNEAERYASEHLMNADQWEAYGKALERMHPTAILRSTDRNSIIDYHDFATLMTELTAAKRAAAFLFVLS